MADADDRALRTQLVQLLKGRQAHADIGSAVEGFPIDRAGERPNGLPYSAWQLVEHIRIALHDILDFSTNSGYLELKWPDDYWPKDPNPPSPEAWQQSVRAIHADLGAFEGLVNNPHSNLYDTIPWGKNGETLLREALLAADHTSYHTGELVLLRKLLGVWHS